tara:strand:- start:101 stop:235 length:135 start_codon:yes stop_codon:yes gene_type:complete
MNGIEKVKGVKNHKPRMFTLDFIDTKKSIEKIAIQKEFVFFFTT